MGERQTRWERDKQDHRMNPWAIFGICVVGCLYLSSRVGIILTDHGMAL